MLEDLKVPNEPVDKIKYVGRYTIFLMDPKTGEVERRQLGPDMRLGAVEK